MKTYKNALLAATSALALSFLTTGCDRTVSKTESEKVKSDGTVEKKEKSVTVSPDGTTNKTEIEKKTTPP
jgi:ABC-type phosphate/phosphonate transport system substrate-binding protein